MVRDILGDDKRGLPERSNMMMVTPKEVDLLVEKASYVLSLAINMALQPQLAPEDILALTS